MNQESIIYKVSPALEFSERLTVSIKWDPDINEYVADIEKGLYPLHEAHWIDRNKELETIVMQAMALRLPVFAESDIGLDGVTYEFQRGGSVPAEFSWWCDLPSEWSELGPIIARIESLVERALVKSQK